MMMDIPPLPVMKSLATRQVPLEEFWINLSLVCCLQCVIEQLMYVCDLYCVEMRMCLPLGHCYGGSTSVSL